MVTTLDELHAAMAALARDAAQGRLGGAALVAALRDLQAEADAAGLPFVAPIARTGQAAAHGRPGAVPTPGGLDDLDGLSDEEALDRDGFPSSDSDESSDWLDFGVPDAFPEPPGG